MRKLPFMQEVVEDTPAFSCELIYRSRVHMLSEGCRSASQTAMVLEEVEGGRAGLMETRLHKWAEDSGRPADGTVDVEA